jgi:uncharacterized protein (TIGR02118 family)
MVRVTASYDWADGARFDHRYYQQVHLPLTASVLSASRLLRLECDQALFAGPAPAAGASVAQTHAYFADEADAKAALALVRLHLAGDVRNYTSIQPTMRLSQVTAFV